MDHSQGFAISHLISFSYFFVFFFSSCLLSPLPIFCFSLSSCVIGDDGKIYCEDHAPTNEHVTQCAVCKKEIAGECFMVGDDYFHEKCLVCVKCGLNLQGQDFYGGASGLVCGRCAYG